MTAFHKARIHCVVETKPASEKSAARDISLRPAAFISAIAGVVAMIFMTAMTGIRHGVSCFLGSELDHEPVIAGLDAGRQLAL